jgi:hypothetical protein
MLQTEGGLKIRPENLRHSGKWHKAGTITWSKRRRASARISFRVVEYLYEAEVILNFTVNGETMEQKIESVSTVQHDGGRRWWFLCSGCGRRMGVLYLPPGRTDFRCRGCYRLRYRSQQKELDFLLKPLAAELGVPKRVARRYLEEAQGVIAVAPTNWASASAPRTVDKLHRATCPE